MQKAKVWKSTQKLYNNLSKSAQVVRERSIQIYVFLTLKITLLFAQRASLVIGMCELDQGVYSWDSGKPCFKMPMIKL